MGRASSPAPRPRTIPRGPFWDDYAGWHLGLTVGATDETKARYAFVFGDFRRIHRTGSSPALRAAEWRHKAIELAAHELLQLLDKSNRARTWGERLRSIVEQLEHPAG